MDYDFMKRGYLLPKGCKDLIDAMRLKASLLPQGGEHPLNISKLKPQVFDFKLKHNPQTPVPLPPVTAQLVIPDQTTVSQLAALLGQKPFNIVADVMQLGVFAFVDQVLDFETISNVARKYGYLAIKPA